MKTINVNSTEKYIIYFEGDKVKTVYSKKAVALWKSIADKMGFSFKVQ